MHDNRMPSPKSAYPQHQPPYASHPEPAGPSGPEQGHPLPPQPGMPQDSQMHRDHDPRPPSVGPKRMREWEDERESKKPASDENRARLSDGLHRRPSPTPPREAYRRNSSEARRFEEQRRLDDQRRADEQRRLDDLRRADEQRHGHDGYHPSEAAHHPPSHSVAPPHLPPIQQGPSAMQNLMHDGPQTGPAPKDYPGPPPPTEDRPRLEHPPAVHPPAVNEPERAARTMEEDDDYDDNSGEEDKKNGITSGPASGPGSATGELKNGTPTSASINGIISTKVEAN